jgi:hypothetical protein
MSAAATNTITLHRDGRFEGSGFSGASFSNEIGDTRSGGTFGGSKPATSGQYRIDGYTLQLRYADGHIEHLLFYFMDKERTLLMLDGTKYRGGLTG